MVYLKNRDPWDATEVLMPSHLDNFETIYTEISGYLAAHNHDSLYFTQAEMASYWNAANDGAGSGADADLLYKSTGNLHAASFAGMGVPTGLVILWYGSTASIPSGWHLCDGTGGTINLGDRMPVGAGTGSAYSVGDQSGAATFTATGTVAVDGHALSLAEMGPHRHPYMDAYGPAGSNIGGGDSCGGPDLYSSGNTASAGSGSAHGHSAGEGTRFAGDAVASMPFFMSLAYIQKI